MASDSREADKRESKRYLVKWKIILVIQTNGVSKTFHGTLSDISTGGASALIENNIPAKTSFIAAIAIPPKTPNEKPQVIQANCQLIYCVLSNNGLYRIGMKFDPIMGNGLQLLEKELDGRIALKT